MRLGTQSLPDDSGMIPGMLDLKMGRSLKNPLPWFILYFSGGIAYFVEPYFPFFTPPI